MNPGKLGRGAWVWNWVVWPEDRGWQPRWSFFCKVTENLMIQQYIWSLQRYLQKNWRWRRKERLACASGGDGRGGDSGWRYWEGKYFDNHLESTIWEGDYFDNHPNIVVVVDTDDFFDNHLNPSVVADTFISALQGICCHRRGLPRREHQRHGSFGKR